MRAPLTLLTTLLLPWLASADPAAIEKPVVPQRSVVSVKLSVPADATTTHCALTVTVRNISEFPVIMSDLNKTPYCKLQLKDKDGKPCELISGGDYLFSGSGDRFYNRLTSLKKGEEKSFVIWLSHYCNLHATDYTLDFGLDAGPDINTPEEIRQFEKAYPRPEYSPMAWVKAFKFTVKAG